MSRRKQGRPQQRKALDSQSVTLDSVYVVCSSFIIRVGRDCWLRRMFRHITSALLRFSETPHSLNLSPVAWTEALTLRAPLVLHGEFSETPHSLNLSPVTETEALTLRAL
ncbi:hypothetical protein RRG08_026618 [Elysia crispata]|uniref:Uncharacterized protein n=1 Tax=Elysia crispata TaxID=231223 RepID=A0AAE1B011_9GAST|nr:hypothetical protein RRG08_026618 [Elysia crispata]